MNNTFTIWLLFVVVCTDISGKELNRQVGVDRTVISRSLGGGMVSNAKDVGSIPILGTIFPTYITPMTLLP